ncbi:winged helix DNA-binding protein [Prevotella sp. HUN102]|uniref:winged helix DNA-binding protein n=1 Tax=Prevotella sp. HUN102 TaxID=1392486 RepID=UPI001E35AFDC|nr:winged helix DNA-binding protein [Prevotella sp. HUN102]
MKYRTIKEMEPQQADTLCKIRNIQRAIISFETQLEKKYQLCLNEAMLLCTLRKNKYMSSGEIAEALGLTCSNTSKVIKSVENKKLVERINGDEDRRQMYFSLSKPGYDKLSSIKCDEIAIPSPLSNILQLNL